MADEQTTPDPDPEPTARRKRAHAAGGLVRHAYTDGSGQQRTRYGLVVDPDGPQVAWLPAEPAGHLELEVV